MPTNLEMGASHGLKWNRYRLIGVQPEGSYFGEHTCLLGEKRVATVVAVTFSELNSLSRLSLERMAGQWPELIQEILMLLDGCAPVTVLVIVPWQGSDRCFVALRSTRKRPWVQD